MKHVFMVALALLTIGLVGCESKPRENPFVPFNAEYQRVKAEGYRIQPGDVLDITFFYTPEYNATNIPVRPDGKIQLPLVGDFQIAGMTPSDAGNALKQQYTKELKNPDLAVLVKSFGSNTVAVQGSVRTPAEFPLVGDATALQMIAKAGGALPEADMTKVTVVRHAANGQQLVVTLDLQQALEGKNPGMDVPLLPGDIIYVPNANKPNVR